MGDRGARMRSTLSDTFWILVLSIVVLFAFFIALGAFSPGEVVWLTLAVLALALLWAAHAVVGRPPPHGPRPRDDPQPRAAGLLSPAQLDPEIAKVLEGMLALDRAAGARGAGGPGAGRPRGRDRAPVAARASRSPRCATSRSRRRRARSPRACTGPRAKAPLPLVVYLHGGGWMLGSIESFDTVVRDARQRVGRDRRQRRLPARARGAVPGRAGGLPVRGPLAGGQRRRARRGSRAARDRGRQRRRQPGDGRRAPPARRGRPADAGADLPGHRRGLQHRLLPRLRRGPRAHRRLDAALLEPLPRRLRRAGPGRVAAARGRTSRARRPRSC